MKSQSGLFFGIVCLAFATAGCGSVNPVADKASARAVCDPADTQGEGFDFLWTAASAARDAGTPALEFLQASNMACDETCDNRACKEGCMACFGDIVRGVYGIE